MLLGLGCCFAPASWRSMKHFSVSPLPNLLQSCIPKVSWKWHSAFYFERKWLQENIEKFMMFNKRRRWSHSSRVKFPLVNMSASCWSTSRFPFCLGLDLWFREPFHAAPWVGASLLFDERNTSITTSHKSRASSPSILKKASNEIISDSAELWDTDVCFLNIQLKGTNARPPKMHEILLSLILNLQGHWQNLSLGINPIDNAEPCFLYDKVAGSHLCDECMKSNEPRVSHKLPSIWWLIEQWAYFWQFSNWFQFLLLEIVIIRARTSGFVKLLCLFLFANSQFLSTHVWACHSMS